MGATLEEIEKVEIFLDGQNPMVLVQTQDEIPVWTMADMSPFPDGFRFDHLAARSVIRTIAGLRAREFVEPKPESSAVFENADRVVVHFKDPSVGSETVILGSMSQKIGLRKETTGPRYIYRRGSFGRTLAAQGIGLSRSARDEIQSRRRCTVGS